MNILIVKTSAIGDVIHTLPALESLRKHYPNAHISWLVEEAASGVILGHPLLNKVLVSKRKRWMRNFRSGKVIPSLKEIISFIKELRQLRYDLLIDFQGLLKSSLLIACCRADRKVGFGPGMEHAEKSYFFLNEKVPAVDMNIHAVDRELLLLKAIGIEHTDVECRFPLENQSIKKVKEMLTGLGVDLSKPVISLNPMTTWPSKHWTMQGFSQLAGALLNEGGEVIFTGGPGDKAAIDKICSSVHPGKAHNIAGKTDLKSLAAVFSLSTVVISTDTGPMHLADSVKTPVVALFGPTAPWRTGPYGKSNVVLRTGISCSPCLKRVCRYGTNQCMFDITVDDVLCAVKKLIQPGRTCDGKPTCQ